MEENTQPVNTTAAGATEAPKAPESSLLEDFSDIVEAVHKFEERLKIEQGAKAPTPIEQAYQPPAVTSPSGIPAAPDISSLLGQVSTTSAHTELPSAPVPPAPTVPPSVPQV